MKDLVMAVKIFASPEVCLVMKSCFIRDEDELGLVLLFASRKNAKSFEVAKNEVKSGSESKLGETKLIIHSAFFTFVYDFRYPITTHLPHGMVPLAHLFT